MEYDGGFRLACDPKSLLYLFGMSLDYSDALIGGGFNFRCGLMHQYVCAAINGGSVLMCLISLLPDKTHVHKPQPP